MPLPPLTTTGYTRARSMGRIADEVRAAGGSVARVFRRVGLPLRLIDFPDQVILLRDQLALVDEAAREIGDDALAPRASLKAGFRALGPLGASLGAAPTLEAAIRRCGAGIESLLQSATRMHLELEGSLAVWTYAIVDACERGRARNEALALGYMSDLVRHYVGRGAAPLRARLPARLPAWKVVGDLLDCDLEVGTPAALLFPAAWLATRNPRHGFGAVAVEASDEDVIPAPDDLLAGVAQLLRLGLLDRRPTLAWVAQRLGVSSRTLQRRLGDRGNSLEALRDDVLRERAADLLVSQRLSMTEIAYELGYAEPSHFTRAARRWAGESPRRWQRRLADALDN